MAVGLAPFQSPDSLNDSLGWGRYDPWEISKGFLCDHWSEWRGMGQVVEEERAKGTCAELQQPFALEELGIGLPEVFL